MKRIIYAFFTILMPGLSPVNAGNANHYPVTPVPFTAVKVTDGFWYDRLHAVRETTIPLAFHKCEESGRYANFVRAAHPSDTIRVEGFPFDDTDVYKTIEGASYLLQTYPDRRLEKYIDSLLVLIENAQEPDGYLNTARTMNPQHPHDWMGPERWKNAEQLSHEFYNLGHLIDGAVAHYQATGKRNFLDIAIRYADCVCRNIGDKPGQTTAVPGHQIAEMALARLYLVTGDAKYLDQARYFLDKRGHTSRRDRYSQAHLPVTEQTEATGHAVRAVYMYSGMADVAALTGDTAYIGAIKRIWKNMTEKKYYLTGGIGATREGEAFGANYELPNATAYCETCAAIGNIYFNHRLFLLEGDACYYDILERTLYNGVLPGISIAGNSFFYPNPLASSGDYERQPWFGCACCPSNLCRFLPSVPGYVYAVRGDEAYVNLFMPTRAELTIQGKRTGISQITDYPWDGKIRLEVSPKRKQTFTLNIRIPGWARNEAVPGGLYSYADGRTPARTIRVNGIPVEGVPDKGYFRITRTWKKGDIVEVCLEMEPRVVKADKRVKADRGRLAVERGPLVYCAEWPDNGFDLTNVLLNPHSPLTTEKTEKLGGITEIKTQAQVLTYDTGGRLAPLDVTLTLIPYYAWAHRGPGAMAIWLPATVQATGTLE